MSSTAFTLQASLLAALQLLALSLGYVQADEVQEGQPSQAITAKSERDSANDETAIRIARLEKQLTGSSFVGRFSDDSDKQGQLREERYEIISAKKMPSGDMWLIQTRIKYGDKDITVPIPLPIKWAGTTPVITLDQLTIPGLGTFDAKVVIAGNRYAGTWQHGEHGGHLFGRIETDSN